MTNIGPIVRRFARPIALALVGGAMAFAAAAQQPAGRQPAPSAPAARPAAPAPAPADAPPRPRAAPQAPVAQAPLPVQPPAPPPPPPAPAGPTEVTVGTYVNQVYALNLKDNVFTIDFYIWFRWKGDAVNPIETFELMNGKVDEKTVVATKDVGDIHYAQARIKAIINKFWDVTRFPLDTHDLQIFIEDQDGDVDKIRYVADSENANYTRDLKVVGYHIAGGAAKVFENHYNTNYGDITLPPNNESVFSRYSYTVTIDRPGYSYFLKLFSTIFISAMVGFLAFLVKPIDLDPRFGLGVGALFAVVASTFIISSTLPDSDRMTMADHLNIASMAMIFLSLIQSAVSLKVFEGSERGPAIAKVIDTVSVIVFPIVYVLWIVLIVALR